MAQVGEDVGIPKVDISTRGIDAHATAEDFGAGIGNAFQKVGGVLNQTVDYYGQIAADDATNEYHKKVDKILYGDPDDPSNPGYFGMKGSDAMRERPNVQKALQAAADESRQSLSLPQSKLQFDAETRRSARLFNQQIGSHYDQQSQAWALNTNADKLTMAEDAVARNPNDSVQLGLALTHAREAAVRIEQLKYGSDADVQAAINKADQGVRLKQLDALRVQDPQKALDLLTKDPGGEVLRSLPNYASLVHEVQNDAVNASTARTTRDSIDKWKNDAAASVHAPTTALAGQGVQGAAQIILAGETVQDPYSAGPDGDYKVAGLGQFTTAQWEKTTGQKIAPADVGIVGKDPRLDPAKARQAVAQFAQQNRDTYYDNFHREPTAGDLALMHQQGTTGGLRLLHALVEAPNAPASNFVSAQALKKNGVSPTATVAQAVRHIEDYYVKKGMGQLPQFDYTKAPGMVAAGNLDPWNRPVLKNPDGGYSTTSSISVSTDKGEVLIPTVVDGKRLSNDEAIAHFKKTGENLGTFKDAQTADAFATKLHEAQASMYDEHGNPLPINSQQRQYTSQSDFLADKLDDAVEDYRNQIADDPAFAGREDLMERAVSNFENKYRRAIRDQNLQYQQDAHMIQSMVFQNKMTSEDDIMAASPEAAQAWMRLQFENPQAAESMRNWFKANAGGQSKTYGTQFTSLLARIMAPVGDPNRITDPSQINKLIQPGENGVLTNSGAAQLLRVYNARGTPQGERDVATLKNYLDQAHTMISPYTKQQLGMYWPEGEKKYQTFVGQTLEMIQAGRTEGKPLSEILKKGGDVDLLLGRSVPTLAEQRKAQQEIVRDARQAPTLKAYQYLSKAKGVEDLSKGIKDGVISPAQARQAVVMNALDVNFLKQAYDAKIISWDDAAMALEHLRKYRRNYYGKPVQ